MIRYFVAGVRGSLAVIWSGVCSSPRGQKSWSMITARPGATWHLPTPVEAERLRIVQGDLKDLGRLKVALLPETDTVFHFASNPDIALAAREPDIDFWEGTYLTQNLLEAMRVNGVSRLVYAREAGYTAIPAIDPVAEDHVPLRPISTYGASKLACEALIRSYCHMFDFHGLAFRFANVVGPRQTHGVGYDFVPGGSYATRTT